MSEAESKSENAREGAQKALLKTLADGVRSLPWWVQVFAWPLVWLVALITWVILLVANILDAVVQQCKNFFIYLRKGSFRERMVKAAIVLIVVGIISIYFDIEGLGFALINIAVIPIMLVGIHVMAAPVFGKETKKAEH